MIGLNHLNNVTFHLCPALSLHHHNAPISPCNIPFTLTHSNNWFLHVQKIIRTWDITTHTHSHHPSVHPSICIHPNSPLGPRYQHLILHTNKGHAHIHTHTYSGSFPASSSLSASRRVFRTTLSVIFSRSHYPEQFALIQHPATASSSSSSNSVIRCSDKLSLTNTETLSAGGKTCPRWRGPKKWRKKNNARTWDITDAADDDDDEEQLSAGWSRAVVLCSAADSDDSGTVFGGRFFWRVARRRVVVQQRGVCPLKKNGGTKKMHFMWDTARNLL